MLIAFIHHFSVSWDPGLKGVLIVTTGIVILVGSVYLLLGTNLGSRVGFLVTVAGLSGWLALMGFVWCMYGIGYKGTAAHWNIEEILTSRSATDLGAAKLAMAHDLPKWKKLAADAPARADAQASATAALIGTTDPRIKVFSADTDFKPVAAYTVGGKKKDFFSRRFPGPHPPHYTIVQVQAVKKVTTAFGATPPKPVIDPNAPIESVIMVRDLGKLRVPSFMIMFASLLVFGITCNVLHRRDKALMAARAAAAVA